ncbi:MAG: PAS domain S-box protein [Terrimicrobiaceae bacterium]|nr:PAS domain S-box protein [Terrimicrobiaceae bacterium]
MESEDEAGERRFSVLQTATSILQIRQRAEQEIRRSNDALAQRSKELAEALVIMRATLESATDAILVTDGTGAVTHFNEKYLAMWGIAREALEGASPGSAWSLASSVFSDPKKFLARIGEIATVARESFDVLELSDGRIFELYSKVLLIGDRGAGRVWSFRDVTERHHAEIVSFRLAAIVASSDDAIIGKDLEGIITSWNSGAERIFGYTAQQIIGTSIMRLVPRDRQAEEHEILARIRNGERLQHFETIRLARDGRPLDVSLTISPIKNLAGHVVGASKVARDITGRKKVEAELKKALEKTEEASRERLRLLDSEREARAQAERASRMKDEFLATLSHELRTPLNAVLGWAALLQQGQFQGEDLKQGLATIERNARVQAQIIEDLLDMSRIISGKVRLDVQQQIDLPAILNDSIDTVRASAEAKGVRLQAVVDPFAGPISGDPNRLQQIFWNVLNNAIKFTPKGGRVHILLERVNSHVEISVLDTGEGIAPEFLPYVFDRFQQADASTTRRHGGLGLGLAIVKQLVELHGGSVRVKSGGIGQGAAFVIQLPLVAVQPEPEKDRLHPRAVRRETEPLPAVSLANVRVLVVDDETDARELMKRLLEMAGATVSTAGSAAEAMESILKSKPDVLVCDIGMPKEDGYSLIRRIRELEKSGGNVLPAVALTAYARSEDRTKAIQLGFQNHLAKPVEPDELLAVVSRLSSSS